MSRSRRAPATRRATLPANAASGRQPGPATCSWLSCRARLALTGRPWSERRLAEMSMASALRNVLASAPLLSGGPLPHTTHPLVLGSRVRLIGDLLRSALLNNVAPGHPMLAPPPSQHDRLRKADAEASANTAERPALCLATGAPLLCSRGDIACPTRACRSPSAAAMCS